MPVVTLTIYFGPKEWDGPLSLHEMFAAKDARLLSLVPDYKLNLIAPALMKDDDFGKLKTTLKEVLAFVKYSVDEDKLAKVLVQDEGFHHLGRNEMDVLNACVGAKLTMSRSEEEIDMCIAIQRMEEKAANKERILTLTNGVNSLMQKMGWTAEQSMDMLNISENDRKQLLELIN